MKSLRIIFFSGIFIRMTNGWLEFSNFEISSGVNDKQYLSYLLLKFEKNEIINLPFPFDPPSSFIKDNLSLEQKHLYA
jgi:hypothetical protein